MNMENTAYDYRNSEPKDTPINKQMKIVKAEGRSREQEIVALLKQGDPEGLDLMIQEYHDKLLSVANRICKNPSDAEEILQDVYMTVLNKIDQFMEKSALYTWIYRITVNAALMRLRNRHYRTDMVPIDKIGRYLTAEENPLRSDAEVRAPDASLQSKELMEQIFDSAGHLPQIYQDVFLLRDVEGFSIKETSKFLNITPAAIKSRLHRGRSFLKESLQEHYCEN